MVDVLQKGHDEDKLFKDGRWVDVTLARHAVSCWPKREGMYCGSGDLKERWVAVGGNRGEMRVAVIQPAP